MNLKTRLINYINNFSTSGYDFNRSENLQKFRFTLLNFLLLFSAIFALLNFLITLRDIFSCSLAYQLSLLIYSLFAFTYLFILRKNRQYYDFVVHSGIVSAWLLFFFILIWAIENEFRLIWFFLLIFVGFILVGRKYGFFLMLITVISVFLAIQYLSLSLSYIALVTFFISFFVFTVFTYMFLYKIEQDEEEFNFLNKQLQLKVSKEVHQRKEQEKMLLQQCRLASMGEMIDSIAHQWRQPLMNINAILMNMERAIELKHEPIYLEHKMEEIVNLTSHMSQTIEDFRFLFREEKNQTLFSVLITIEHVLELFKESLREIDLKIEMPKEVYYNGYENQLLQVLIVLLSNAVDALKETSTENKQIIITCYKNNNLLKITIEDNAGGILSSNIERVFDPYFTTKKSNGGTGLGLYISKIIIEKNMQGTLRVNNSKKGAKFEITLKNQL